jgi:hypothetical protein
VRPLFGLLSGKLDQKVQSPINFPFQQKTSEALVPNIIGETFVHLRYQMALVPLVGKKVVTSTQRSGRLGLCLQCRSDSRQRFVRDLPLIVDVMREAEVLGGDASARRPTLR